ncbi:MAG: hypothetical protein ACRENI_09065 [Gemmatimonadaceae bacterium]
MTYAGVANVVLEPGVSIHYWGLSPYVYVVWGAGAFAFAATIIFRSSSRA